MISCAPLQLLQIKQPQVIWFDFLLSFMFGHMMPLENISDQLNLHNQLERPKWNFSFEWGEAANN